MKVVIVDKNVRDIRKIQKLLKDIDQTIQIEKIVEDIPSLRSWLNIDNKPDLILVDPQETLAHIGTKTVHAQLVLRGTRFHKTYFALRSEQLAMISTPIKTHGNILVNGNEPTATVGETFNETEKPVAAYKTRFLIEQGKKIFSIPTELIAYFYSEGRFVFITTFEGQKYLTGYRMEELGKVLNPAHFYRINRSYIISIQSIQQILLHTGGRYKIKLFPATSEEIFVSRSRLSGFRNWLDS